MSLADWMNKADDSDRDDYFVPSHEEGCGCPDCEEEESREEEN